MFNGTPLDTFFKRNSSVSMREHVVLLIAGATLIALITACAPSHGGNSASTPALPVIETTAPTPKLPDAPTPTAAQETKQVGTGTRACPFSDAAKDYETSMPTHPKLLSAISSGRYVLTEVRTSRMELAGPLEWSFANGTKTLLQEPGRLGHQDTIQVLIKNTEIPLTAGNLSFPLSFQMKSGEVIWERFASYEPEIDLSTFAIHNPDVKIFDEKILSESTIRFSFNAFAKRNNLGAYSSYVHWTENEPGSITGRISVTPEGVHFFIYMLRSSGSIAGVKTNYEMIYQPEGKAKGPDCGGNASVVKLLGTRPQSSNPTIATK